MVGDLGRPRQQQEARPPAHPADPPSPSAACDEPRQLTIDDADYAASFAWRQAVDAAIRARGSAGRTFTSDDVRHDLTPSERGVVDAHPNAYGARFSNAARRGEIVCVGTSTSTRRAAHGRLVRVWRGAVA